MFLLVFGAGGSQAKHVSNLDSSFCNKGFLFIIITILLLPFLHPPLNGVHACFFRPEKYDLDARMAALQVRRVNRVALQICTFGPLYGCFVWENGVNYRNGGVETYNLDARCRSVTWGCTVPAYALHKLVKYKNKLN